MKGNEGCVSMTHSSPPGVTIKFSIRSVSKFVVHIVGGFSTL